MAPKTYDIGDDVILTATFKDRAGTLTNPTTVACRVERPDGTIATVGVSSTSTGVWSGTFQPTMHGTHWYRFEGTGAVRTAAEAAFIVAPQRVT